MVNDLVDKEQMRAMVGANFSEARWDQIAKGRDKIMKTELMDAVRTRILCAHGRSCPRARARDLTRPE